MLRMFIGGILLALTVHSAARELRIVEPSMGLAFSELAVNRSAEKSKAGFLADMEHKGKLGCAAHCSLLAGVWAALLPSIRYQQADGSAPMNLIVVTGDAVDAMSFPDGAIVVSESLIARMALGEEQIAFVLAHEAAHVLLQHERQTLTSMLALMPVAVRRSPGDVYTELEFRYFSLTDSLSVVSHQAEFEADEVGLQLAALAGFAPDKQLRFMESLSRGGDRGAATTMHPAARVRLERLRQQLPLARRLFEVGRE